jgi:hypothetical protein
MSWVIAAYGVVAAVLIGYWIRLRRARRDLER